MNTSEKNQTLSARQTRALEALLRAGTVREAARQARVGRTTLHEWLRDETFRATLRRERYELHEAALRQMQARESEAVEVLAALLRSPDERLRLSAAREILDLTHRAQQEERLETIENRLDELTAHETASPKY